MPKNKKWENYTLQELLKVRICDLKISTKDTFIENNVLKLYEELKAKGLIFKPHIWVSDEWQCPDGVSGFGIPFFILHPKLRALERRYMFEVEGGTSSSSMKLLRHETAHAIDNAFGLRKRKRRQKIFGLSSQDYPSSYVPQPYSQDHVVHLESWYAQAHPDEDWAETFAEWLRPRSNWKKRYHGQTALHKLHYVNDLMKELQGERALNRKEGKRDSLDDITLTLGEFYERKQERFTINAPMFYCSELLRLFSSSKRYKNKGQASDFIESERKLFRRKVSRWTGQYQIVINRILDEMVEFCKDGDLCLTRSKEKTKMNLLVLITAQATHYLSTGKHWIVL